MRFQLKISEKWYILMPCQIFHQSLEIYINPQSAVRFCEILAAIWNNVIWSISQPKSLIAKENIFYDIVRIVSADDQALLSARTFAGTLMTKYESCIDTGWALEGLTEAVQMALSKSRFISNFKTIPMALM